MYLIHCDLDNSDVIVADKKVIGDKKTIRIGDDVLFFHEKEQYHGKVILRSDNEKILKKKMDELKKNKASSKRKIDANIEIIQPLGKRSRKPKRNFSFTNDNSMTKQNIQSSEDKREENETDPENDIMENGECEEKNSSKDNSDSNDTCSQSEDSPTEIPPPTTIKTDKVSNKKQKSKKPIYSSSDDEDNDLDGYQLYGPTYENEKMKEIGNGIYCKMSDYKHAVKNTYQATAAARNLLVGVFKKEILLKSTLTGRTGRSLEPERRNMKMIKLHDRAKETIIDFTLSLASKKKWEHKPCNVDRNKVMAAMSQRIVELKLEDKKNVQGKKIENKESHDGTGHSNNPQDADGDSSQTKKRESRS